MNDLNAQQIVLLTLLVSFVTSIATGITTVSLLEQAPEPVSQTVNRIVEKTIERVVPDENNNSNKGNTVKTPEKEIVTVVVNQEDLTIEAVQKNTKSLARIYFKQGREKTYVTLGIVVDNKGTVLVDTNKVYAGGRYVINYAGTEIEAKISFKENKSMFALLVPEEVPADFSSISAKFSDSQNLKLAQSVINLSGVSSNTVSTGIITGLYTENGPLITNQTDKPTEQINLIETSVDADNVLTGSILLNLQGEIVGAKMGGGMNNLTDFRSSNSIKSFLTSQNL